MASGHAPEALLDTYAEERGPVARQVLSLTHAIMRVGTLDRGPACTLRDHLLPLATRSTAIQRRAARRLSQVAVDYRGSSLAAADGGTRAADQPVSVDGRGMRLYELLRRRQHVLLVPAGAMLHGLERIASHLVVAEAAVDRVTLIRPDGFVAARARGTGLESLIPYLELVFGTGAAGASVRACQQPCAHSWWP